MAFREIVEDYELEQGYALEDLLGEPMLEVQVPQYADVIEPA